MKVFTMRCALFLSLFLVSLAAAQEWSDPVNLGNGYTPDMDIDPVTGKIYVVHHNNGLIYTVLNAKGEIISQENVGVASGDAIGRAQYGATIAFDPKTQQPHVCYRIFTSNDRYNIFYIRRKADDTWTTPLRLVNNLERAYSVRLEVDSKGVAHVVHGQVDGSVPYGVATYLRLTNGVVDQTISDLRAYRVDDRVEISVGSDDAVNIILSSPDDVPGGSSVTYFQSTDGGSSLIKVADIPDAEAIGRNGNADIFADKNGNVHIAYGSAGYPGNSGPRTVRYARYAGSNKVRDVVVNDPGELQTWHHNLGIGSVAASDDGKFVVMAYTTFDGGQLRARLSATGGDTWSGPISLASMFTFLWSIPS